MSAGNLRTKSPGSFLSPRGLRGCEQVAAVCYRINGSGIEFLLVQNRNGRWTFPKGGVEPGLTHAQSAAMEAFEEGGVHGRIEQTSFARYTRRKNRGSAEVIVHAHLCEVQHLVRPQESNRIPTWFSPERTRRRLGEHRNFASAAELDQVVDRAVARIRRLLSEKNASPDALQKVQFEPLDGGNGYERLLQASFARFTGGEHGEVCQSAGVALVNARLSRILRLAPSRSPRLLTAAEEPAELRSTTVDGVLQQSPLAEHSTSTRQKGKSGRT